MSMSRGLRIRPDRFAAVAVVKSHRGETKCLGDLLNHLLSHRLCRVREQQSAAEGIESFHFALPVYCFLRPALCPRRKLAGRKGCGQKRKKSYPVLRVGNCECSDRRKKEEVEAQHRCNGGYGRFNQAARRGDQKNCNEIEKSCRCGVDRQQAKEEESNRCDEPKGSENATDRDYDFVHRSRGSGMGLQARRANH